MNEIDRFIQEELLSRNKKIFFIILYGCGGVVFLKHFYEILGHKNTSLMQKFIDYKLIKLKRVGKNQVVILKHAVYCYFNLENKTIKFTDNRLLHSALLCELILHTYIHCDKNEIEKLLLQSNFCYFAPRNSFNILNRIYTFMSNKNEGDLTVLFWSLKELEEKIQFIKTSSKGRKDKLPKKSYKTDDLLTLKSNDIYIKNLDYKAGAICLYVAIFATEKTADKIVQAILKAETALTDMLAGINIKIFYDIYSLNERSEYLENKVYRNLIKGDERNNEKYKENVKYHWYNCKNSLFSGIDIKKWL